MSDAPIEIKGQILGAEAVGTMLLAVTPEAQKRVRDEVARQGMELLRSAKQKLSDDVLHVRTGRLRRSVNAQNSDDGSTFRSNVGTNVVYARIHEMGGTIPRPLKPSVTLATIKDRIRHPRKGFAEYPQRSFLQSSLRERKGAIKAGLVKALSGIGRPKR